jgi:hypothetical protein
MPDVNRVRHGNHTNEVLSSLRLVNGLITHLVCGSENTELCPHFRWTRAYPKVLDTLGESYGIHRINMREVEIKGNSVVSALYFTRSLLEAFSQSLEKIFLFPIKEVLYIFKVSKEWSIGDFVSNAKYYTCYMIARYMHQEEMPEMPASFVGIDGKPLHPLIYRRGIRKILKNRLVSFTVKNTYLFGTILLGVKRACFEVPDSFILNSYLKHKKILSTPPQASDMDVISLTNLIDRALKDVKPIKQYRLLEASTSACWEAKRDEGGQREVVREFLHRQCGVAVRELSEMYLGDDNRVHDLMTVDTSDLIDVAYDHYKFTEHINVMVHALTEPLKVRLITKGEAIPYYISRHFQKEMWRYLQNFPQFSPTGRPLEVDDLECVAKRMRTLENKYQTNLRFDKYVSGDYSAATDGVDIRMTLLVFNTFADKFKISDKLRHLLYLVIGPQYIHYPCEEEHPELGSFLQQNGQLMGSTLSFPILCIINIIAYWDAMEAYVNDSNPGKHIQLDMSELPVLVNGDDIFFPANDFFYEMYWKESIKKVGFNLSLGKNYISDKICTMNSMIFHILPNDKFRLIPFMNIGLLTGVTKHGGRTNDKLKPITDIYQAVISGSLHRKGASHGKFLNYYKDSIKKYTNNGQFNLMIPWECGGLGFQNEEVKTCKITPFQRCFASYVKYHADQDIEEKGKISKLGLIEYNTVNNDLTDRKHISPKEIHFFRNNDIIPEGYIKLSKYNEQFEVRSPLSYSYDFANQPLLKIKVPGRFLKLWRQSQIVIKPKFKELRKEYHRAHDLLLKCIKELREDDPFFDTVSLILGRRIRRMNHKYAKIIHYERNLVSDKISVGRMSNNEILTGFKGIPYVKVIN